VEPPPAAGPPANGNAKKEVPKSSRDKEIAILSLLHANRTRVLATEASAHH
jgi:hypothetical protein